ncbi:hypothetical protein VCRA2128O305_110019 [Vibrio crassostreae]|nr:hypothetical protein VCRA2112E186_100018 [Vibrio crassostreae]CAK1702994.1 hypothetical protein VCRA2116O233_100106 [Vibrio crassostreae]CAK1704178.1 hypothetical protein VCRA2113O218_100119 [Vibrio crassostreae]CAK1704192.1 hypothetical protein VCRA2118O236_100119 [Vibrio crassostreae]CAK1711530.1 hypothetical protein VCRA2113O202_110018 [Vibrio crassostreae]
MNCSNLSKRNSKEHYFVLFFAFWAQIFRPEHRFCGLDTIPYHHYFSLFVNSSTIARVIFSILTR